MSEIDIIEKGEAQVNEFSALDGVFRNFEESISVFETAINIADDDESYFSEDSETGQLSSVSKDVSKEIKGKTKQMADGAMYFARHKKKKEEFEEYRVYEIEPRNEYDTNNKTKNRTHIGIGSNADEIGSYTDNLKLPKENNGIKDTVIKERKYVAVSAKGERIYITASANEIIPDKLVLPKNSKSGELVLYTQTSAKNALAVAKKTKNIADVASELNVDPVTRTAMKVAKLVKDALKAAGNGYKNVLDKENKVEYGYKKFSREEKEAESKSNVWSPSYSTVHTVKKNGCLLVLLPLIAIVFLVTSSFVSGAIKIVLKAAELKSQLNSYLAIFEGKTAYSGTGKAKNLTEYTDTTERMWVEKYCETYDMQGWEEVCLAICMTESGGLENSANPMGVVSSSGNYVTGFYSGSTESGIAAGVQALKNCAYYYEYHTKKKADPSDTDCILIVVNCYAQGIDFARYVAEHNNGEYSDSANDEYAIEKNNEGANNMFYGSYYLNGSDGSQTLGGRNVPVIGNNFLNFFDLTKEQTGTTSTDDNVFEKIIKFLTHSSSSSSSLGAIAQNELGNYGNKYWDWCHSGQVDWCGIFVSWCADQAGLSGEIPFSMSAGMIDNLDQTKVRGESYTPKAGDLITFDDTPPYKVSHIAIVSRVENGRVYYIGGNQGEGDYSRNTGVWCSYSIVSESSIPIGDTSVYKYYVVG